MKLLGPKLVIFAFCMNAAIPAYANVQVEKNELPFQDQARAIFNNTVDLSDVQLLSRDEMRSTEGAINPFVVGAAAGAAINGIKYGIDVGFDKGRTFDKADLAKTMAVGAGIGSLTTPAAAVAGGGFTVGANVWRFNGAAANFGADQALKSRGHNRNGGSGRW